MIPTDLIVFLSVLVLLFYLLSKMLSWAKKKLNEDPPVLRPERFISENGYSWDFVFVFAVMEESDNPSEEQRKFSLKNVVARLQRSGLETKLYFSVQKDEVYVKVRAPLPRLKLEADRIDYLMKLDPNRIRSRAERGKNDERGRTIWAPVLIPDDPELCSFAPFHHIYGKYDGEDGLQELYAVHDNGSIFRGVDRIKLLINILEAHERDGGCGLNLTKLQQNECVLASFPLHDNSELFFLQKKWLHFVSPPWKIPIDDIRDYFGEKITLYFTFLSHYTTYLLVPGILGIGTYLHYLFEGSDHSVLSIPIFAFLMAVWATLFIESWKRKESTVALRFGMSSFENEEEDRPEFQGELILSPIDGSSTVHFPSSTYHQRMALSITIILFLIFCVIGAVGGIFVLKLFLLSEPQKSTLTILGINLSSIIAAIANAVQIQIMNAVYNGIAIKLNDMENHQTDTIYEDNLIAKVFVFNCVNSYASLFYIGFIKELVGDPCIESCMAELNTTLGTIFLTKLVVGSLQSIVTAYMANQKRLKDETAGIPSDAVVTPPEYQYIQQEYHYMLGTFKDYADNMIQYGYATLFVASFPLAPIMAFFSNYIELLVDGWKLCQLHRRPIPKGAQDIGTWMGILEVMGFLSVLTNVGMICFTGDFLDGYSLVIKFAAFLILEHILLGIKSLVGFIIPDVPEDVETQLARQEFIVSKVILNMKDDELDMDELGVSEEEGEEKEGKKFKFKQAFEILHEDLDYIYPKEAEDEPIGGFLGSILTALGMNKKPVEGEQDDEEEEEMTELMD